MDAKERFMGAACGARIRRRRQELGMTQLDLARRGVKGHFDWCKAKTGPERMK